MENKTSRCLVGTILPFDYLTAGNDKAKEVLLVLHGFAQNSEQALENIVNKLSESILSRYRVIIPNGIFPIPKIRSNGIQYRYSWYFYDGKKQRYHIDMNAPIEAIRDFLNQNKIDTKNVTLLGYSQGGYLAPILASHVEGIKKSISINANTRVDKLGSHLNFEHVSIHNEKDPIVEFENSYKSHEALKKLITKASYLKFDIDSHELKDENIDALNRILEIK